MKPISQKQKILKRTPLRASNSPLKRTKLRIVGASTTAQLKKEIQRLVRACVMIRDGGCILRFKRHCGGNLDTTGVVIQADHLINRGNSATFADTRLIVCICRTCHGWKKWHKNEYEALIEEVISKERVKLWDKCEKDSWKPKRVRATDWRLHIVQLERELISLEK